MSVGFAEALRNAPVRAAGKSQGRQRSHRDNHATDDLHGLSLLDCTCTPRLGDAPQLSGDPHWGDKPLHQPTPNGLPKPSFKEALVEAMIGR